jgi:hypothetical protein
MMTTRYPPLNETTGPTRGKKRSHQTKTPTNKLEADTVIRRK